MRWQPQGNSCRQHQAVGHGVRVLKVLEVLIPHHLAGLFLSSQTIFSKIPFDTPYVVCDVSRISALLLKACHKKHEKFHPTLQTLDRKEP
jgi:hypothetical protein